MAKTAEINLLSGAESIKRFNSGKGKRCFCRTCGSSLWFESLDYPHITAIPLGVLDPDTSESNTAKVEEIPAPEIRIWVQSTPNWCAINDDLPQFDNNPSA